MVMAVPIFIVIPSMQCAGNAVRAPRKSVRAGGRPPFARNDHPLFTIQRIPPTCTYSAKAARSAQIVPARANARSLRRTRPLPPVESSCSSATVDHVRTLIFDLDHPPDTRKPTHLSIEPLALEPCATMSPFRVSPHVLRGNIESALNGARIALSAAWPHLTQPARDELAHARSHRAPRARQAGCVVPAVTF
jgi:hypothetical protein